MKLLGLVSIIGALSLATQAIAQSTPVGPRVGDTYEVRVERFTSQTSSGGGSSGSSRDRNTIVERVVGLRPDGLELEYDLPKDVPEAQRASDWQFPARIFRPNRGPLQLLNRLELEARIETWLKAGNLSRAECGRWIFTWRAFRIECDPQSVIKTLEMFDLRVPDLREGVEYKSEEARGPAPLAKQTAGPDGATFRVELEIDPDAARRARAESDVVVAELMRKPLSLDAALHERAKDVVSGTISITLDADPSGNVRRRTKVSKVKIVRPDGRSETMTVTETVERRLVSESSTNR